MPKNITLSMPDDVAADMEAMPEVNWSAVAKGSIKTYIEARKKPDITPLIENLLRQKTEEYVNGRKKADEIAEKSGYRFVDIIVRKCFTKSSEIHDMEEQNYPPWEIPDLDQEFEKILLDLKVITTEASGEFLKGIRERLIEIYHVLNQQE
ncbi:MAG: hypothetical protein ABSC20_03090 [Candidatus Bathyarchaeia archaeon]|jgi:hypothetical protein